MRYACVPFTITMYAHSDRGDHCHSTMYVAVPLLSFVFTYQGAKGAIGVLGPPGPPGKKVLHSGV